MQRPQDPESGEEVRKRLVQQSDAKFHIRNNRLRFMAILYVLIFFSFAALQTIAIAFFTRGFLLSRQVLDNHSTLTDPIFLDQSDKLQNFDKAVVVIIDALRFDFTVPDSENEFYYRNNFLTPYNLNQKYPQNSVLLKFIADPPTTTLQRLKGLTTGSLPTFVDAGSNFDGDVIHEDNFIKQLYSNNRSIAFVGDDTWEAVFSPFLNTSYPYDSLNVWDLHTVDNGVIEHMIPMLDDQKSNKWDVLIGHTLGVDHCGHRYGPSHFSMRDKQKQMDTFINDIIDRIDDKTLLVVMGDHGMDRTGNHGGDSLDELEAALWLYSKKNSFHQLNDKSVYDISNGGKNYRSVNQIDLVPTFSLLMGLPIPFNNLGKPIEEAFDSKDTFKLASYLTMEQIQRYRYHSTSLKDDELINNKYKELKNIWNQGDPKGIFAEKVLEYEYESLERCKDLWARFDLLSISIGIILLAFSLVLLVIYSKLIPSVVITQLTEEIVPATIAMVCIFTVIFIAISVILKPSFLSLLWFSLLGAAIGIIFGFLIPILDRYSIKWLFTSLLDKFSGLWSLIAISFMVLHAAIFGSNSFTIWEDKITSYFLITFGFLSAVKSLDAQKKVDRVMGVYHSVLFMITTRLVSLSTICREEQGSQCTPTFKLSWWMILALFVNAFFMPSYIRAFYNITSSYHSAAPLWINMFKVVLVMITVYWSFEYLEFNQADSSFEFIRNLDLESLHFVKYTLARIIAGIALIAANVGWSRGPLCVKLEIKNTETSSREACILGYQNVYGSQYFLLVMNFTAAILLFTKPLGQLSISILIYQILSLFELVDILGVRANLISPVVLGLLGYLHFFSTGHQATIPSIHWEVGFTLTEKITFPFTHLAIVLNTFGPFIIVALSVSLITLWKIPPSQKPISLYSRIIENCGTLLIYETLVALSALIFATVFRRHLMVWKIFAPRFMFAGLVQIVINIVLVTTTIGFSCGRLILQINRIFGK
ncbi:putative membrane protein [Wickerhamomyces ciferrii]|uniref:Membrane protein n=1 Tax=Wickerhamomyces ciferrii (strain ATCC 14091 / BCRC 22168 / CBS 111 / JCM 3599 / NBRC 0793 / NRRL Y-1031 F-60-10) TaxID=1206466 RepID=K0KIK2_WICCF|nr:uncharacterized protein BN7_4628 [Wickerhamomyces ciferrii]CCH45050.1 putative membrane protein [Wickerhamomyces ciferrii]